MSAAQVLIVELTFLGLMVLSVIGIMIFTVWIIIAKVKKKKVRLPILLLLGNIAFEGSIGLLMCSHAHDIRFNDWYIVGNNINTVCEKYGEPDKWSDEIVSGKRGVVRYFLYMNNSPVMPDHLPYWYWIYYNEQGIVEKVCVQTKAGA